MKNILLPFVLNENLQQEILDFVYTSPKWYWTYNPTAGTKNRYFCTISDIEESPLRLKIEDLRNELYTSFNLKEYLNENFLKNFIGVNTEGGNVHIHRDNRLDDYYHTRINFLVQKPLEGGMPIVNDNVYDIDERQCWFNNASEWFHGSTVVGGTKDRVVLSVGAYISPEDFLNIDKNILKN